MDKKKLMSLSGRIIHEAAVGTVLALLLSAISSGADLSGANLFGANLYGADLCGADLCGADLPSPSIVLVASWGEVTDALTTDLMNYDASCHPDPDLFTKWSQGGSCPYTSVKIERACWFKEKKHLYNPQAPLCRPYDLMMRLLTEKCPPWTEEKHKEFQEKFKQ